MHRIYTCDQYSMYTILQTYPQETKVRVAQWWSDDLALTYEYRDNKCKNMNKFTVNCVNK